MTLEIKKLTSAIMLLPLALGMTACSGGKKGSESQVVASKAIYGEDDILEVFEVPSKVKKWAKSTAVQIHKDYLRKTSKRYYIKDASEYGEGICSEERFMGQLNIGNCSGFLVGKDLLVTAGHCVNTEIQCDKFYWVFDYQEKKSGRKIRSFSKSKVYSCKKILSARWEMPKRSGSSEDKSGIADYALIQLDRPVYRRSPLSFRTEGKIEDGAPLATIGYPKGLPGKVVLSANVRNNEDSAWFSANLDTFKGSSGSPVFNLETGEVEGILVRGEKDYEKSRGRGCEVVKRCEDDSCKGEDVTRITLIKKLMRLANGETESQNSDRGEITQKEDGSIEYQLSDDEILPLNDAGQTLYPFFVKENFSLEDFKLRIKVDHTYLGDLAISLIHPSGREVILRSNRHFIYRILDTTYTFENGESYELEDLKNMDSKGEWTIQFKDLFPGDVGTLKFVYLKMSGR